MNTPRSASQVQDRFIDIQAKKNCFILSHTIPCTLSEMEYNLKSIKYHGQRKTNDPIVEKGRIPSIAKTFYQYLFYFGFPSPEELITIYFKKHRTHETDTHIQFKGDRTLYSKEGVKGRIYRTYPSLIRDFHFYLTCCESNLFEDVSYSLVDDIARGIDLKITHKGQDFAIALFVDTKRSKGFKKKKYGRHDALDLPEICISIDPFNREHYVGEYALYQRQHLEYMIKEMERHLSSTPIPPYAM